MRLLLDTHVFLWWASDAAELSDRVRELIGDEHNEIVFSVVSGWEIVIKSALGRLEVPEPADTYISSRVTSFGFTVLPVHLRHVLALTGLPDVHADPFDRLLVAQARTEGIAVLSRDERMRGYPVELIWEYPPDGSQLQE